MGDTFKGLFSKLLLNLTAISVMIFAIGCLVISAHLSNFSLNDFEVIKPKAVTTGMTCVIIFVLHTVILLYLLHVTDKGLFGQVVIIFSHFLILYQGFYKHLDSDVYDAEAYLRQTYGETVCIFQNISRFFPPIWGVTGTITILGNVQFPLSKNWKIVCIVFNYIFFISGLITLTIFWNNKIAQNLMLFEVIFCALFIFLCVARWIEQKNTNKIAWHKLAKSKNNSLTMETESFKERRQALALLYTITVAIAVTLALIILYARLVFPHINDEYGGGKFKRILFKTKDSFYSGHKILETSEYVFLLQNDSTVRKVAWDDIETLHIGKD